MTLKDTTKCVVELTTVSIYCIDGIYYYIGDDKPEKMPTIEERLQEAIEKHKKDLELFKEYAEKYDDSKNNYWADRIEREKDYKYSILTLAEFRAKEREKYLSSPLKEVSENTFEEMLEVLPPELWVTIDNVNMFCMSEHYTGQYTSQYAWDKSTDKYYTKIVDVTDKSTWIHSVLKNPLHKYCNKFLVCEQRDKNIKSCMACDDFKKEA